MATKKTMSNDNKMQYYINDYCLNGHQLELLNSINCNSHFKCDGCKERGYGRRYRCHICNFDLHMECHHPFHTIQPPYFPANTFDFHRRNLLPCPRFCDACGKPVQGFVYHCNDRGLDLHPCCANLNRKIQFPNRDFVLQDLEINNHDFVGTSKPCFRCKKTNLSGGNKGVPGLSYVSTCGVYRCHVYCMMRMLRREDTGRLAAAAPVSTGGGQFWSETMTFATALTGPVFGDPTTILAAAFINMLLG